MARFVMKSVEMWDKCSILSVMSRFRKKYMLQKGTSFLHHIWSETFIYPCKKHLGGVSETRVIYGPQLLSCRPSRKQLSWQILSRIFKFLSRTSWGNRAIKQIYIFWRILQAGAGKLYNLQIRWLFEDQEKTMQKMVTFQITNYCILT